MPADRLIHPKLGHSEKVSKLSDFEFRVWVQYLLSADDFGVSRASAVTLQSDNDAIACRAPKAVQKAIDHIVSGGLLRTFEHQNRRYLYQHDWQDWQKVEYPRATNHPKAPADCCDASTVALFDKHPGGNGKRKEKDRLTIAEDSPNVPQMVSEGSPPTRADAPAKRLTANGLRLPATGSEVRQSSAPLHDSGHRKHAHCGRVCLHASQFGQFVRRRGHDDADREVRDWAMDVEREWGASGPHAQDEPGDAFDFWRSRYAEKWPATVGDKKQLPISQRWRPTDEAAS